MNVRLKTLKLLEKNTYGKILQGTSKFFFFLERPQQKITSGIGHWGSIKLQKVCTEKEAASSMKRQPTEGEEIFVNYK